MACLSHRNLHIETTIHAPCDTVWESLTDINCWNWNDWVRLDADVVLSGGSGQARLCQARTNKWKTSKFTFGEVSRKNLSFSWTTKLRLVTYTNSIRLVPVGPKTTTLKHTISVQGVLCMPVLGRHHDRLRTLAFCMNESLKNHVESAHFQSLLTDISTRAMQVDNSDLTTSSDWSDSQREANYWTTPRYLREVLVSTFLDEHTTTTTTPVRR